MQAKRQVDDGLDCVAIVPGIGDAAVDPGAAPGLNELDRLVDRRLRDAGVYRHLDDLKDGAVRGRLVLSL